GIPIDEARESVFRFGSTSKETGTLGLSVFGIGMKRAFFKLGRMIAMRSRTEDERSEEHTSELQSRFDLVCRLLLEKKKNCATAKREAITQRIASDPTPSWGCALNR